jgi:hypothetical protein
MAPLQLAFLGILNRQVINGSAHAEKCAREKRASAGGFGISGLKPHRSESERTLRSNRRSNGRRFFGTWLAQPIAAAPDGFDVVVTA